MTDQNQKPALSDLIDIAFLQKFQDFFAEIMGVASITVDDKGPITKPSNFTDFCIKYTRGSEEGYNRCNACDIKWGEFAAKNGKPAIYKCHSGLVDFAVPIIVGGKHVASILGGQVLDEKPDENHFRELARELGVDEDEYIKALRKIKILKKEQIESAVNFMHFVANAISKIGHKNLQLLKKNEREKLIINVINKIRSSLNLDEILHFICEELTKIFDVQRAAISVFPKDGSFENFLMKKEYTTLSDITKFPNNELAANTAIYWGQYLATQSKVLVLDDIEKSDVPDYFKQLYREMGIKSAIGVSIQKGDDVWGTLVLSDYAKFRHWDGDEINLLLSISDQVYIAINQGELYKKIQEIAQREVLLRSVIETVRSSLDLDEVKKNIVYKVGKAFNADRCFFRSYNRVQDKFLPPDVEYLSSDEIISLVNIEPEQDTLKYFIDEFRKQKKGFSPMAVDMEKAKGTPLEEYLKLANIQTDYAIPIVSRKDELTWLVLHYAKPDMKLSEDDKKILETIAYQIDIAFEQIELYNNTQKIAQRESLLRNITDKIRSSLNLDDILSFACEEITMVFNVQHTIFTKIESVNGKEEFLLRKEYSSSPDIGIIQFAEEIKGIRHIWDEKFLLHGDVCAIDNIQEETEGVFREFYEKLGVKSIIGINIKKGEDVLGVLFLSEYDYCRHWTDEEKDLLVMIANQIYIAINQAELYEKEKLMVEREKISRNIVEILRSSIDRTIIKKLFVKNIGIFFKADRVLFSEYDSKKHMYLPVDKDSEYLSSVNEKSFVGYDWSKPEMQDFVKTLLEKREINICDIDEYISNNQDLINLLKNSGIYSTYNFPVLYQNHIMGFFSIEFTQKAVCLSDEEVDRIRRMCTQAGIALYHADLYLKAQQYHMTRKNFVSDVSQKIIEPTNNILDRSILLSNNEFERAIQIRYLNSIISSCNELIELTKNISED